VVRDFSKKRYVKNFFFLNIKFLRTSFNTKKENIFFLKRGFNSKFLACLGTTWFTKKRPKFFSKRLVLDGLYLLLFGNLHGILLGSNLILLVSWGVSKLLITTQLIFFLKRKLLLIFLLRIRLFSGVNLT